MNRLAPVLFLQASNFLSSLANSMVLLLIPWLVLTNRDSPAEAGLVIAVAATPAVAVTILAGALADRIGARRVSIGSDALSAISVLLFPVVLVSGSSNLLVFIALATLGATFDPAGFTARKTLIPNVASRAQMSVPGLNSIHEAVFGSAFVLGPAATGLLIANFGLIPPFFVATAMFVLAALLMVLLPVTSTVMTPTQRELGIWHDLKDGVRALWEDKLLSWMTLSIIVLAGVYLPVEGVLLPTYFEGQDLPQVFGLILTALGAGATVGALLFASIYKVLSARTIFTLCLLASGAIVFAMSSLPQAGLFIALGGLLGLAWGPMQPLLNTLVQTRIRPGLQGRVFGIQVAFFSIAPPLGYLVAGVATEGFGVGQVFVFIAVTLLAVGALSIWGVYRR
jgi:MFS family permease